MYCAYVGKVMKYNIVKLHAIVHSKLMKPTVEVLPQSVVMQQVSSLAHILVHVRLLPHLPEAYQRAHSYICNNNYCVDVDLMQNYGLGFLGHFCKLLNDVFFITGSV